MKNEFVLAFNEVLEEKGLPKEVVIDALQAALASAYRRHVNASNAQHVDALIDSETGKVSIFAEKEVVDDVADPRTEVSLNEAQRVDAAASLGSMVIVESTPKNFGRVAAQTARQVIQQRIREAERDAQFNYFSKQVGEIMSGVVQAVNAQGVTLGLEMKAEGAMPRAHQIPGERFRVHDRMRALLLEVKSTPRGPQIILSRAHRNFLRRLLENEVPEIYHGLVELRSIAREPGQRSKVAVSAMQPGVDPVGACVGIRGVRIQAIVRELNDEKIDVIEWSADPAVYIAKALSPARVSGVYLNEQAKGAKTATVVVPEDQLSLAIGRDGQNARLAAKLTSWRIDIKSLPEAATDALHKLQTDPKYVAIAEIETEIYPQVEAVLAKKAEGRPVTPEEYHVLTTFVDRIERGLIRQHAEEKRVEEERELVARANVPTAAFEIPLDKFEVSDRVFAVISDADYQSVGDLMLQLEIDPDVVWRLKGMGPKAMNELQAALALVSEKLQAEAEAKQAAEVAAAQPALHPAEVEAVGEAIEAMPVEAAEEQAEAVEAVSAPALELSAEPVAELKPEVEPVAEGEPVKAAAELAASETKAETEGEAQPEAAAALAPEAKEGAPAGELVPAAQGEGGTLDELFAMRLDNIDLTQIDVEEDEEGADKKKQAKKKKKKFIEVVYDPDKDAVVVKKKRKRGEAGWEEDW